jgi:hypothetical protein
MKNEVQTLEGIQPDELNLEWVVLYENGEELRQNYKKGEENGEHHFGHIDQDRLAEFYLEDKEGNRPYSVNLKEGYINLKGQRIYIEFPKGEDVGENRLVYYFRVRNDFAPTEVRIMVTFLIGIQALIDGKNYQEILFIKPDGTLALRQYR